MNGREIYKIWAPYDREWTRWVRPVCFVDIDIEKELREYVDYDIPEIYYKDFLDKHTCVILDVDGEKSIKEGIGFAVLGYRPIPLFNGTTPNIGVEAVINNELVEPLLLWGALELKEIEIPVDAPAVFLLDKNRMNRYKYDVGIFDNSWDIYHQDMPSANYLLKNKINKVILQSDLMRNDICQILYKYQEKGIEIFFTDGYSDPKLVKIRKYRLRDN